jgi:DNA-directed RNA polymerase subunit RPC12/RpoP
MKNIYIILMCKRCKKTTVLLTEEVEDTIKKGKYLSCAHCGNKRFINKKSTDNAKECMKSSHYKRVKGYIRQVD